MTSQRARDTADYRLSIIERTFATCFALTRPVFGMTRAIMKDFAKTLKKSRKEKAARRFSTVREGVAIVAVDEAAMVAMVMVFFPGLQYQCDQYMPRHSLFPIFNSVINHHGTEWHLQDVREMSGAKRKRARLI
jgi:hypothetical protein